MASMMARPMLAIPTSPRPWIPASVSMRTKSETPPLSFRTGTFFTSVTFMRCSCTYVVEDPQGDPHLGCKCAYSMFARDEM